MTRYRKRPVVVEARRFVAVVDMRPGDFWYWDDANTFAFPINIDGRGPYLMITTLEGVMVAADGDWIIRGVKGEFYPCKPDIFEVSYEPAD